MPSSNTVADMSYLTTFNSDQAHLTAPDFRELAGACCPGDRSGAKLRGCMLKPSDNNLPPMLETEPIQYDTTPA